MESGAPHPEHEVAHLQVVQRRCRSRPDRLSLWRTVAERHQHRGGGGTICNQGGDPLRRLGVGLRRSRKGAGGDDKRTRNAEICREAGRGGTTELCGAAEGRAHDGPDSRDDCHVDGAGGAGESGWWAGRDPAAVDAKPNVDRTGVYKAMSVDNRRATIRRTRYITSHDWRSPVIKRRLLAVTLAGNVGARLPVVAALCLVFAGRPSTQAPSAADGPWSGWAQCVLTGQFSGQGQTYSHQQTHTWVLTSSTPGPTSSSAIKQYAATWQVTGQGTRQRGQGNNSEQWTTAGQAMPDTLTIRLTAEGAVRIGGAAQLRSEGTTTGTAMPYVNEWPFPVIEGPATQTSIVGSAPSASPANFSGAPPGTTSTVTCSWNFVRGGGSATPPPPPRSIRDELGVKGPGAAISGLNPPAGQQPTIGLLPGSATAGPAQTSETTVTAAPSQRTTTEATASTPLSTTVPELAEIVLPPTSRISAGAGPAPTNIRVIPTSGPRYAYNDRAQPIGCSIAFQVTWDLVPGATGYSVNGVRLGPDTLSFAFAVAFMKTPVTKQISVGASFADRLDGVSAPVTFSADCPALPSSFPEIPQL